MAAGGGVGRALELAGLVLMPLAVVYAITQGDGESVYVELAVAALGVALIALGRRLRTP